MLMLVGGLGMLMDRGGIGRWVDGKMNGWMNEWKDG